MATPTETTLPAEIMDVVIDQLCTEIETLGVCATVCSQWMIRSRYHIFSTVHLWPQRARRFFELAHSQLCTFTKYVSRVELDDARFETHDQNDQNEFLFDCVMSLSSLGQFSHIESLRIRNVDWTLLSLPEQERLRMRLVTFSGLRTLEFDDVMFHDLREVVRIVALFPTLSHVVANVQFSKYIEHAVTSATTLALPDCLEVLRLESDESIPVFLSTVFQQSSNLTSLILEEVKFWHCQYIGDALRGLGSSLRHFELGFSREGREWITADDLAKLDFTHQTKLQTLRLNGITPSNYIPLPTLEIDIPSLISRIPSSKCMRNITLCFIVDSTGALELFNWSSLQRAIRGMERCKLNVDVETPPIFVEEDALILTTAVKGFVGSKLGFLKGRKRLSVRVNG